MVKGKWWLFFLGFIAFSPTYRLIRLFLGASLALPVMAFAVSFDCSKANLAVEKLICSNEALSKWDDDLQSAYNNLLNVMVDDKKQYLVNEQRSWISYIRNTCKDEKCLDIAYRVRTIYFRSVAGNLEEVNAPGTFELVTKPKEVVSVINDFQSSVKRMGIDIQIQYCPIILSAPFYRSRVYGVVCQIGNKMEEHYLMMCDDTMVGHLTISGAVIGTGPVKEFTKDNCFKGG